MAASVLSAAVGMAMAAQVPSVRAQGANPPQIVKDNMARAAANKLEKCYGINAAAQARNPKSFVLLPGGDCAKI